MSPANNVVTRGFSLAARTNRVRVDCDEVITEIHIPAADGRVGAAYEKYRHPASGYAVVGVAAVLKLGAGDVVEDARLAVTGCTSKATRLRDAEQALIGKPLNAMSIMAASAAAANGLDLNGDHYASAEYRQHLLGVYTGRAIEAAAAR